MPRGGRSSSSSSSRSFGGGRSSSPPMRSQSPIPHKTTTSNVPMQTQQSGGMMSGLGSTLMTGMAFGAGSEIAHQAVRGVIGSGSSHGHNNQVNEMQNNQTSEIQNKDLNSDKISSMCNDLNAKFIQCLQQNGNDISDCQVIFNEMKSCQK